MDYKNIIVTREDNIVIVTINREKVLNALNNQTIDELLNFFRQSWKDNSIGCVIITGAGKSFIAGADISELARCDVLKGTANSRIGHYLMRTIEDFPRPVIAAVNGFALGGGCELALACDIIIASENAKFGLPEVNLGIHPGFGGTQRLPRLIGTARAKELIFTGNHYSAQDAFNIGLVNKVVASSELLSEAKNMAKTIAYKGPVAVKLAKDAINRGIETTLEDGLNIELDNIAKAFTTEDKVEGMDAFVQRRKPEFKGK